MRFLILILLSYSCIASTTYFVVTAESGTNYSIASNQLSVTNDDDDWCGSVSLAWSPQTLTASNRVWWSSVANGATNRAYSVNVGTKTNTTWPFPLTTWVVLSCDRTNVVIETMNKLGGYWLVLFTNWQGGTIKAWTNNIPSTGDPQFWRGFDPRSTNQFTLGFKKGFKY